MSKVWIPVSTYRLQMNKNFGFREAFSVVQYLYELGISHVYLSPITKARKASDHGYDVTDPKELNPELGSVTDFINLVQHLKKHGMGILLDIVPNHMAISQENPYWMDFLENGYYSPYASFFDLTQAKLKPSAKVILPVLPAPRDELILTNQFSLKLDSGATYIIYGANTLPISVRSYRHIAELLLSTYPAFNSKIEPFIEDLRQLPDVYGEINGDREFHYQRIQECKKQFMNLISEIGALGYEKIALSSMLVKRILKEQVYELIFWKLANNFPTYRRFFSVNELIGINVQDRNVYNETHSLVIELVQNGSVHGLRVDHIDGLFDPAKYLADLQSSIDAGSPEDFYVLVEKILASDEELPEEWLVYGTTGYEFINLLEHVLINHAGIQELDRIYEKHIGDYRDIKEIIYLKKKLVIRKLFSGEMLSLGRMLYQLALNRKMDEEGLSASVLTRAISEMSACLPVYRTYLRDDKVRDNDSEYFYHALREAKRRSNGKLEKPLKIIEIIFNAIQQEDNECLDFFMRWQQFTGAIMAKGFEDTTLYAYNKLLSLNEVGGDPSSTGISLSDFHEVNLKKRGKYPHSLNATTTHDTKRSEDIRSRLDVLTEQPGLWAEYLQRWVAWNGRYKTRVGNMWVPERNTELHIYQTLIGAWPLNKVEFPQFIIRLKAYLAKAAREAKVFSTWQRPWKEYEEAISKFVDSVIADNKFSEDLNKALEYVSYYGALNSLAQLLIKATCPGIPDFYQGTDIWNLTLVDPDNRQPVDYESRKNMLVEIKLAENNKPELINRLINFWQDGRIKLYITYKLLNFRRNHSRLFEKGIYQPLYGKGILDRNVCAYMKSFDSESAIFAAQLHMASLTNQVEPTTGDIWNDTYIDLATEESSRWLNVFTDETVTAYKGTINLNEVFRTFPAALLTVIN